ncbi:MAG: hypothetical protein ACREKH_20180 [Candidatus Rokuibacteriota bacterium]
MCDQDARNVRAMRKVVHRETGRKPPKRLKFSTVLVAVALLCDDRTPSKPPPRGGRSQKELGIFKRAGIDAGYVPSWLDAWRTGGLRAWARHVFVDLDQHAPGCRWAALWSLVARRIQCPSS